MSRFAQIISGIAGLMICFSLVTTVGQTTAPAEAATTLALPWYVQLVKNADKQTWNQQPGSRKTGKVIAREPIPEHLLQLLEGS